MPIVVSPTASLDIITVEEAAAALNAEGGQSPVTLQGQAIAQLVSATSRKIDALCGPVVIRTVTDEEHNGGEAIIRLRHAPVVSVTSVTEWDSETSSTIIEEVRATPSNEDYRLVTRNGKLYRRAGGFESAWRWGRNNVLVTYDAGRYTNTATVDEQFKYAASMLFRHLWTSSHGVGSRFGDVDSNPGILATGVASFGVPQMVRDLLSDQIPTFI